MQRVQDATGGTQIQHFGDLAAQRGIRSRVGTQVLRFNPAVSTAHDRSMSNSGRNGPTPSMSHARARHFLRGVLARHGGAICILPIAPACKMPSTSRHGVLFPQVARVAELPTTGASGTSSTRGEPIRPPYALAHGSSGALAGGGESFPARLRHGALRSAILFAAVARHRFCSPRCH